MELSPQVIGILVVTALVIAITATVLGIVALAGQRRTRRAYRVFARGSREDVLTLLQRHIDEVGVLRSDVERVELRADELRELVRAGISRMATVRYDAFEDMGGQLSFSAALLDERGNGMVLTSINGRTETRMYAKSITAGESRHQLSDEESEAIALAFGQPAGDARMLSKRGFVRNGIAARDAS